MKQLHTLFQGVKGATLVLMLISSQNLRASEDLTVPFVKGALDAGKAEQFAFETSQDFDRTLEKIAALKYMGDAGVDGQQLKVALEKLQQSKVESEVTTTLGLTLHWYLVMGEKDELLVYPLVAKIDSASAAFKAGVRDGDLIESVNGHVFEGGNSLAELHCYLRLLENGGSIEMKVKRHDYFPGNEYSVYAKKASAQLKFLKE